MSNTLRFLLSVTIGAIIILSIPGCGGSTSENDDSSESLGVCHYSNPPRACHDPDYEGWQRIPQTPTAETRR